MIDRASHATGSDSPKAPARMHDRVFAPHRMSVISRPTITYKNDASTRLLPSSTEPATLRAHSDQNARRQRTIEFWRVRSREHQADQYAANLGQAKSLARFLELNALDEDLPVPFIWLTDTSHPPVEHRIDRLAHRRVAHRTVAHMSEMLKPERRLTPQLSLL